jgi:cytochrome c-type biogenesis protein CcmH/NrfG
MTTILILVLSLPLVLIPLAYSLIVARPLLPLSKSKTISLVLATSIASLSLYLATGSPSLALQAPASTQPATSLLNQALTSENPKRALSLTISALQYNPSNTDKILASRIIRNHDPENPIIFSILSDVLKSEPSQLEAVWFSGIHLHKQKQYKKALPLLLKAQKLISKQPNPKNKSLSDILEPLIQDSKKQLNLHENSSLEIQ